MKRFKWNHCKCYERYKTFEAQKICAEKTIDVGAKLIYLSFVVSFGSYIKYDFLSAVAWFIVINAIALLIHLEGLKEMDCVQYKSRKKRRNQTITTYAKEE